MENWIYYLLIIVVVLPFIFYFSSQRSLKRILKNEAEGRKLDDRFIVENIIHSRTGLNLVYSIIPILTFILAILGVDNIDKIKREVSSRVEDTVKVRIAKAYQIDSLYQTCPK
jgi:hypothetical protein